MSAEPGSRRKHLERLAWLLDNSIPVPFTKRHIGLDSLVGLVPGIGDAIGGLLSTWILFQGMQVKVPWITFMRMVMNVAVEVVVGIVPVVGDLFDMGWKANHRNVELLADYLDRPVETARSSVVLMMGVLLMLIVVGVVSVSLGIWLFATVFSGLGQLWTAAIG